MKCSRAWGSLESFPTHFAKPRIKTVVSLVNITVGILKKSLPYHIQQFIEGVLRDDQEGFHPDMQAYVNLEGYTGLGKCRDRPYSEMENLKTKNGGSPAFPNQCSAVPHKITIGYFLKLDTDFKVHLVKEY